MVTLTAMALRSTHTDTVTLIVGFVAVLTFVVFTCRRFDSVFVAVLTCCRYDLSPLNRLQYRLDEP